MNQATELAHSSGAVSRGNCRYPDCDCEPPCDVENCAHCDGTTPCIHCGSDPLPPVSSSDKGAR